MKTDENTLPTGEGVPESRKDRSLWDLLHNASELQASIKALPAKLIEATERELAEKFCPTETHIRLKIAFWDEYRRASRDKRAVMKIGNAVEGVCSRKFFYERIIPDPLAVAWLITPPPSENIVQKQLLQIGMRRLQEVLELPIMEEFEVKDKKTQQMRTVKKINVAVIKEIRAITEMLMNRVHGGVIQRAQVDQRSLNLNVDAGKTADPQLTSGEPSLEQIEKLISRIETVTQVLPESGVIDVSPEEAE